MNNRQIITAGLVGMSAFVVCLIFLLYAAQQHRKRERKCFPIVLVGHDHIVCLDSQPPRHLSTCRACRPLIE